MSAYEEIENPADKQEVRDLALLATQILAWAGPDKIPFEEALAAAWKQLDQAAEFLTRPEPVEEQELPKKRAK